MKPNNTNISKIGKYKIYRKISQRGWVITIMPAKIRIDNYHGFPHIHYSLKGTHNPIEVNDLNKAFEIVTKYILNNETINKEKLRGELL
jgi:hypothetical protein